MTTSKKTTFLRFLAALTTAVMMFCVLCGLSTPASAASIDSKYPKQSITGYILATNNKTAIAYSNRSCSNKIGYIYTGDTCPIQEIYTDGVVKVKCPWTGYKNDRVVYSKLSYFFQNTSVSVKTAIAKTKCYNKSDIKTSPGYVYAKDKCYIVGASGNYYQALVPWNTGGYKLCWVNKSAFSNTNNNTSGTNSSAIRSPMNNPTTSYTTWGQKVSYRSAPRNYHLGVDYGYTNDKNIYSITSGTVKSAGYNNANGNYVVIQHTISGKTVYSFYAHMSSYCVKSGDKVNAGTKIGVIGATGNSSGGTIHLHFAITDKLSTNGGYYGYSSAFSGNSTRYDNMTFYNPIYVINNGKLP